jgi:WD40 repeat protein
MSDDTVDCVVTGVQHEPDSANSETRPPPLTTEDLSSSESTSVSSQLPNFPISIAPCYLVTTQFESEQFPNNFLKSALWSPDGLCLLVSSDDNCIRLFEVPLDEKVPCSSWNSCGSLSPALAVKEGETIYDMAWYPSMNSSEPSTCCFFSTSRDNPVHVWDAFTGEPRGIYSAYTDAEELDAAYSFCFDNTGPGRLYCGFNNCIRIFDIERPGREHSTLRTFKRAHGQSTGQRGIISCAAFNPDRSGLLAAGSYSRNVGLYDARAGRLLYNLQVAALGPPTRVHHTCRLSLPRYVQHARVRTPRRLSCCPAACGTGLWRRACLHAARPPPPHIPPLAAGMHVCVRLRRACTAVMRGCLSPCSLLHLVCVRRQQRAHAPRGSQAHSTDAARHVPDAARHVPDAARHVRATACYCLLCP